MNFLWSQTKLINPLGNICDFIAIMFRQGYQQKNNLDYWLGTHLQLGNTMAPTSSEDFIRQLFNFMQRYWLDTHLQLGFAWKNISSEVSFCSFHFYGRCIGRIHMKHLQWAMLGCTPCHYLCLQLGNTCDTDLKRGPMRFKHRLSTMVLIGEKQNKY